MKQRKPKIRFFAPVTLEDMSGMKENPREPVVIGQRHRELVKLMTSIRTWMLVLVAVCLAAIFGHKAMEQNHLRPDAHVVSEEDSRRAVAAIKNRITRIVEDTEWLKRKDQTPKPDENSPESSPTASQPSS